MNDGLETKNEKMESAGVVWGGLADTLRQDCHDSLELDGRSADLLRRLDELAGCPRLDDIDNFMRSARSFTKLELDYLMSPLLDSIYTCVVRSLQQPALSDHSVNSGPELAGAISPNVISLARADQASAETTVPLANCALPIACWVGHVQTLQFFVNRGADLHLDYTSVLRDQPQSLASTDPVHEIVAKIDRAMQLADSTRSCFPLVIASARGHYECVEYLLRQGAQVMDNDSEAVYRAVQAGAPAVYQLLVKAGADLVQHRFTLWQSALRHPDIVAASFISHFVRGPHRVPPPSNFLCEQALLVAVRLNDEPLVRDILSSRPQQNPWPDMYSKASELALRRGQVCVVRTFFAQDLVNIDALFRFKFTSCVGSLIPAENMDDGAYLREGRTGAPFARIDSDLGDEIDQLKDLVMYEHPVQDAAFFGHISTIQFLMDKAQDMGTEVFERLLDHLICPAVEGNHRATLDLIGTDRASVRSLKAAGTLFRMAWRRDSGLPLLAELLAAGDCTLEACEVALYRAVCRGRLNVAEQILRHIQSRGGPDAKEHKFRVAFTLQHLFFLPQQSDMLELLLSFTPRCLLPETCGGKDLLHRLTYSDIRIQQAVLVHTQRTGSAVLLASVVGTFAAPLVQRFRQSSSLLCDENISAQGRLHGEYLALYLQYGLGPQTLPVDILRCVESMRPFAEWFDRHKAARLARMITGGDVISSTLDMGHEAKHTTEPCSMSWWPWDEDAYSLASLMRYHRFVPPSAAVEVVRAVAGAASQVTSPTAHAL